MMRKRVTFSRWLAWSAIHAVFVSVLLGVVALLNALDFLRFLRYAAGMLFMLLLGSPVFGAMWAYMYVEWCNAQVPAHHCVSCGYDLTGNVSGQCPECGETHIVTPRPDPIS